MKNYVSAFALLLPLALAGVGSALAAEECSVATLKGKYLFANEGSTIEGNTRVCSPWQAPRCLTARAMCTPSIQLARMGRLIGTSASMASMLSMQIVRALSAIRTVRTLISSSLLMERHSCSFRPILGLWRRGLSGVLWPKGLATEALH